MRRGQMGTVPNNCSHLGETLLHSEMLPNKTPLARCAEAETGSGQHNSFLISLPAVQRRDEALTFQEDRVSQLIFVRFMELRNRRLPHRGRKGLVEQAPLY